ncbi:hypothetical protein ElyMa_001396000 [Elysia marginata]|uniref:Uncharacterized protein n=1 Tax=Elysia marginata TaxID=1093978 RepID=A0AAV4IS66_9GAST|nr:hypothetical protein ElyMa_001396000 [Elysia marginata]
MDPLQFAYKAKRGVEDATLTLMELITHHLDQTDVSSRSSGQTLSQTKTLEEEQDWSPKHHNQREKMEMIGTCMQKVTRITDKASPTLDPSGAKKQRRPKETWRRTVEKDLKERPPPPLTAADRPRALQLPQAPDGTERIE